MANNTTETDLHVEKFNAVECAVLMLSSIVSVSANLFVMVLILRVHRLKTSTNMFVFSLCLCNSMISLVVIPMRTFIIRLDSFAMLAYKYIVIISILIYICNLCAISHHRLLCIIEPMTHTQKQTKQRVLKVVTLAWIGPLTYGILPLIWFKLRNMSSIEKTIHIVYKSVTLLLLLVPLVFMVVVFVKVYKQARNIRLREQIPSPVPLGDINDDRAGSKLNVPSPKALREKEGPNKEINMKVTFSKRICLPTKEDQKSPTEDLISNSGLPEVLLFTPTTESNSKGAADHQSTDETMHLSPCSSIASPKISKPTTKERSNTMVSSGSTSNMGLNTFLSPEHVGGFLHREKAVSSVSLSSLTSRISIPSFQQIIRRKMYEIKASFAFFIVAIGYMVTWIPVVALTLIDIVNSHLHIPRYIEIISLYTISFNALADPFLYGLLLPGFKRTMRHSIRRRRERLSLKRELSVHR